MSSRSLPESRLPSSPKHTRTIPEHPSRPASLARHAGKRCPSTPRRIRAQPQVSAAQRHDPQPARGLLSTRYSSAFSPSAFIAEDRGLQGGCTRRPPSSGMVDRSQNSIFRPPVGGHLATWKMGPDLRPSTGLQKRPDQGGKNTRHEYKIVSAHL